MEIINCEQGSQEWLDARCGLITSSDFHILFMNGRGGNASKTREDLIFKKAAERITGVPQESFFNQYMDRGHIEEPLAREAYEDIHTVIVEQCGFIKNGYIGSSTDGLVGNDGVLEIKTRSAHLQIRLLKEGNWDAHKAQTQGALLVTGREWIDYFSYCPGLPHFEQRAYRDESYIKELEVKLREAEAEVEETIHFIKSKY